LKRGGKRLSDKSERIKVVCSVEDIRFFKNGFGIIAVSINEIKEGKPKRNKFNQIIAKGEMPCPIAGNMYCMVADYVNDPKWGGQYNITSFYSAVNFDETDVAGKKRFLASLFTPLQIENMYAVLDDPYKALRDSDAAALVRVKGCGMDTAARWINRFNCNLHIAKIFTELESYNLTNGMIQRLLGRYKSPDLVIEKVRNNPYVLCDEVDGIGWKTADKMALDGGMGEYCTERVSAFIRKYLNDSGQNGCSWIAPDELMGAILENLGEEIPDERVTEAIQSMDSLWWDEDKTKIGLKKYFNVEQRIAGELIRLRDAKSNVSYGDWKSAIGHVEHVNGWSFTEEQKTGVKTALDNNVIVIHGFAGSGKTSLVEALLEALKGNSFVQCALSGRASSRMGEITGEEGYTIHRLLGYPCKDEGAKDRFRYHDENQLNADIIILDEISMVDAYLFYFLIRSVRSGSKLICLGDMGQLEPIGCGNIAYDMIHSGEVPVVYLSKIHRQAAASAVITDSISIRNGTQIVGKDWVGQETRGQLQDLTLDCYSDKSNTFYKVVQKFSEAMEKESFNILGNQVLVPVKNNGDACTYNINNTIQEMYNPEGEGKNEVVVFANGRASVLRHGDKVINTRNNYKTQPPIFNGNIGIITEIDPDERTMVVAFKGIGDVSIEKDHLNYIELAYSITCHKAQGDQFDHVIFGIDFSSYSLLSRELLYTGLTRAKRECNLIAQTGALRMATSREGVSKKQTHLRQCLFETAHPKVVF